MNPGTFISNGDYIFPFQAHFYIAKHLFLWTYQNGTANPDGIIRLPGRILNLLVFSWFGNIAVGYFFLVSSLLVVFVAFYYFARVFLDNVKSPVALLCALFFTLNPIFLGNLAKIGLILAAAMLPPSLAVIRRAFERQRLRYLLLWVLFMNISLIHPFTFTVNFVVTVGYFLYQCQVHRKFARLHIGRFAIVGITALLLNAYFILPLASMGTVSKDALSSDVTATPVNYTSLVDIANTGDIFTGLSLSKNVLKDFEFYSPLYQNFYFLGAFVLYVVLLGLYLRVESRLGLVEKKRFGVFFIAFLVLIILATVKLWKVDVLIKMLIQLPGGWMFRSPLKWQLYVPLVLFGMLAIVLVHIRQPWHRRAMYATLGLSFLLMNSFIMVNIYHDLLKPRQLEHFAALAAVPMDHQNLLVVGSERCFSFADSNPAVMTELNQVLISKDVQVKQVGIGDIDTVNIGAFDYVIGCQQTMHSTLTAREAEPQATAYHFKELQEFANGAFQLYANSQAKPYISAETKIVALDEPRTLAGTASFTDSVLHQPFQTMAADSPAVSQATGLQDLFDKLDFDNIKQGSITSEITPVHSGQQSVYIRQSVPLHYQYRDGQLTLSTVPQPGFTPLAKSQDVQRLNINLEAGKKLRVVYKDPNYSFINLIANPSFEKGAWQSRVGDCYAFASQSDIGMGIVKDASDGKNALELRAKNHIACTGPKEVSVTPGQHYLLSFDYKNVGGPYGGYYIDYDDPLQTSINGRLKESTGNPTSWATFTKNLVPPKGARSMRIVLYGYPEGSGTAYGIARYDHFRLAAVPDIQSRFNLVSPSKAELAAPKNIQVTRYNPTKNVLHITGASTPFFVNTHESYNAQWRLYPGTAGGASWPQALSGQAAAHFRLNGSMNGWLVDPAAICQTSPASCTRQPDGSYDFALTMEFAPQRLVYFGGIVSGVTAIGALVYFVSDLRSDALSRRFWRRHGRNK